MFGKKSQEGISVREIAGLSNERLKDIASFYKNSLDNEEKLGEIIDTILANIDDFVTKLEIIEDLLPPELKDDLISFVSIQQNGISDLNDFYQDFINYRNELKEKIELVSTETDNYINQLD